MSSNPDSGIQKTFACGIWNPLKENVKVRNPHHGILNPVPGIQSPHHGIRNPLRWNHEFSTWDSESTSWNLESSTWDSESTSWNPESKTVTDYLTWVRMMLVKDHSLNLSATVSCFAIQQLRDYLKLLL